MEIYHGKVYEVDKIQMKTYFLIIQDHIIHFCYMQFVLKKQLLYTTYTSIIM